MTRDPRAEAACIDLMHRAKQYARDIGQKTASPDPAAAIYDDSNSRQAARLLIEAATALILNTDERTVLNAVSTMIVANCDDHITHAEQWSIIRKLAWTEQAACEDRLSDDDWTEYCPVMAA